MSGFMFWGLFLALAAILAGYVVWMIAVERRGAGDRQAVDAAAADAADAAAADAADAAEAADAPEAADADAVDAPGRRRSSRGPRPPAASPDDVA